MSQPSPIVTTLYKKAFDCIREPRSEPYKRGARAALHRHFDDVPVSAPYPVGTPEADAWLAGYQEGKQIALNHDRETEDADQ